MKVLITVDGIDSGHAALANAAPQARFVAARERNALVAEAADAEVLWGTRHLDAIVEAAPNLRWVASVSAGVEGVLSRLSHRPDILVSTGAGTYDIPITEHVLALLLALTRGLPRCVRRQAERRWERGGPLRELHGGTLGVVGLGHIGRRVAQAAHQGLGMTVLGHKRRGTRPIPHVDRLYLGREGLLSMLPECDAVVVAAALSPETRRLLDAAALDQLPPHAVLVNIARGAIVDESDLAARLADGRLAGAGLDVFETEPLPADSPLWDLDNVILTPHTAGNSERSRERQLELFCRQLGRYVRGEPLDNLVDRDAGY